MSAPEKSPEQRMADELRAAVEHAMQLKEALNALGWGVFFKLTGNVMQVEISRNQTL